MENPNTAPHFESNRDLPRDPVPEHDAEVARIAEQHIHDSSSLAPSRADQAATLLRSPGMWVLYLLTAFVIVGLVFMAMHLHPSDSTVHGPADESAPSTRQMHK
jgi:hypothetical protein